MREFLNIIRREYGFVFHDSGVLLIMLLAPLIYGVIYSLTYAPQVLRRVPIGVVDDSRTPSSRTLCRLLNASPDLDVRYEPTDIASAEQLFYAGRIHGVVYIPSDYERRLLRGEQVVVAAYLDASYMLMYRQVYKAVVEVVGTVGAGVESQRLMTRGVEWPLSAKIVSPVRYVQHTLFNPSLGYGSFVMPPVLILIIQQTLLVGIGMIGGTRCERHCRWLVSRRGVIRSVLGRSVAYASMYGLVMLYLFDLHYRIFGYPMSGQGWMIVVFLTIYLFACIFAGMALSLLFRRRESSLMILLWSSIPLLMISGASYPAEDLPLMLRWLSVAFPSTFGVRGFVQIETAGATLSEVATDVVALVVLMAIYFVLACAGEWLMAGNEHIDSSIGIEEGYGNEKIFS